MRETLGASKKDFFSSSFVLAPSSGAHMLAREASWHQFHRSKNGTENCYKFIY